MTVELALRIAELRACENIRHIRIVSVDQPGKRAVVLVVPQRREEVFGHTDWLQPNEPFLLVINAEQILVEHALH